MDSVVLAGDVRLAWKEAGSGPPLVCIHGLGGWRWQKLIPALSNSHRVVAPYLRGFGETEGPMDYAMEDLAQDVVGLVRHLEIESFHLLGHSLGGMVAQVVATDHPEFVESLCLVSTTAHTGSRARSFALAMASLAERGAPALEDPEVRGRIEQVLAEAFPMGPPPVEVLADGLVRPNPAQAAAWRAVSDFSRKDRLLELRCPTLVVHGTHDLLIPMVLGRWIHEAIPGSKWVMFEGAGHSVQTEVADRLAEYVLGFLAEAAAV